MKLGDMTVFGEHPPKLIKALAVISDGLHKRYDAFPDRRRGASRQLCLFCSLVVRDFLVDVGFADTTVRTCAVAIDAERDGKAVQALGIGMPQDPPVKDKFNGHAVAEIPSLRILIDSTIGQAKRERWPTQMPEMISAPIVTTDPPFIFEGMTMLTGVQSDNEDGFIRIGWFDRPEINFRRELDFVDPRSRERRRTIARALRASFGEWRDND